MDRLVGWSIPTNHFYLGPRQNYYIDMQFKKNSQYYIYIVQDYRQKFLISIIIISTKNIDKS